MSFYSDLNKMRQTVSQEELLAKRLESIEGELNGVIGKMRLSFAQADSIRQSMRNKLESVRDIRDKTRIMARTLTQVAMLYERTEAALAGRAGIMDPDLKARIDKMFEQLRDAARVMGMDSTCCFSGDPVNLGTGNYVYENTFLTIPGDMPLSLRLFYNSLSPAEATLGHGWVHNLNIYLRRDDSRCSIALSDGAAAVFLRSDGAFIPLPGTGGTLIAQNEGYLYCDAEKTAYSFAADGSLKLITDRAGNTQALEYDGGRLVRVIGNQGNELSFEYDSSGRLVSAQDDAGRQVRLSYLDGRLSSVINPSGGETRYGYDSKGRLCDIINPKGIHSLVNVFDERGRVVKQTFPDGGEAAYEYLDEQKQVVLTEQNGNKTAYERDSLNRNTRIVYSDGEERFEFNGLNQRTSFTDKRGNTISYAYADNGALAGVVNALGHSMEIERSADGLPEALKVNGETLYRSEYDESGRETAVTDALGRRRRFEYDEAGNLALLVLEDGGEVRLEYDETGNVSRIKDAAGGEFRYAYDSLHRVTATIDGNGARTEFAYNARNNVIRVTNALGEERHYAYDACGNVVKVTDFDGESVEISYNELNKPASVRDKDGGLTTYAYNKMWDLWRQTDAEGRTTSFFYDGLRRLNEVELPGGARMRWQHDACGNIIRRIDENGDEYKLGYDALNRPVEVEEPDGMVTRAVFDAMGNVTDILFANGTARRFSYDAAGQMTASQDPCGNTVRYDYNPLGLVERIYDDEGWIKAYEYYPGGLLKKESGAEGTSTEYRYDGAGNMVQATNQDGFSAYYVYDCLSRLVEVRDDDGACERYTYDAAGNIVSAVDACGARTQYRYSPGGSLIGVTDAMGNETEYAYDRLRRLQRVTRMGAGPAGALERRAQARTTVYERDAAGNVCAVTNPMGIRTEYEYDPCGNQTAVRDGDGGLTCFSYRPDGSLSGIQYGDGKSVRLSYNGMKQLTAIEDWLGVTRIEPDALGRATEVEMPGGERLQYRWGGRGQCLSMTYPDGVEAAFRYDGASRLTGISAGGNEAAYSYDDGGRLKETVCSNGWRSQYAYDGAGRLAALTHLNKEGIAERFAYQYDAMGRRSRMQRSGTEEAGDYAYRYDPLGNLSEVIKDGASAEKYGYDSFGNRAWGEGARGRAEYGYNLLDQLITASINGKQFRYSYDGRGNLTEERQDDALVRSLRFDGAGRLAEAATPGGTAQYTYNGLNRRVRALFTGPGGEATEQRTLFDPTRDEGGLLCVSQGGISANLIWGDGPVFALDGHEKPFFFTDEKRSVLHMAGADGRTLGAYAYGAFGEPWGAHADVRWPGMCGFVQSGAGGLWHAHNREYAPDMGRFISPDPYEGNLVEPATLNRYAYCRNDPVNCVDYSGFIFVWLAGGIVGAVVNAGSRLVGDVAKSIVNGKPTFSSWESYVGSAAGGFVQGAITATGQTALAGAAGAAVETFVSGGLEMATGRQEGNFKKLLVDTSKSAIGGAVSGFAFSKVSGVIKIPGINKGQGNCDAVWRSLITKAGKGQIEEMTFNSFLKGVVAQGGVGLANEFIDKLHGEFKEKGKQAIGKWASDAISRYPGLAGLLPFMLRTATCPLEGAA